MISGTKSLAHTEPQEDTMATKPIIENAGPAAQHSTPPSPDIQAAYQIHTLAHLFYGQLASAPPWPAASYQHAPWQMPHTPHPMAASPYGYWPHL